MQSPQVKPENGPDFENVWKNRDSKLLETPGFIRFALLKGDEEGVVHVHPLHQSSSIHKRSIQEVKVHTVSAQCAPLVMQMCGVC